MRTHAVSIGGALGLALIVQAAHAQDYSGYPATGPVYGAPPENVIVRAPPTGRSYMGAQILNVSVSRTIRTNDLDLRTDEGARVLRSRIHFTADSLCNQLNAMYPINGEDWTGGMWPRNSHCYRNAVGGAMRQARDVVRAARGGTYAGYDDEDDGW